jgi:hypothetical protein
MLAGLGYAIGRIEACVVKRRDLVVLGSWST